MSSDHPTAIDFAYAVHTTIGDNAISAKINGKKASIGAEIHTGDVVEIVLSAEPKAPSRNWLMVATTTNARRKIREYIAKHTTAENVQKGKEMLSAELEKLGYKLGDIVEVYPTIEKDFNFVSLDDMFASVGYKSITIQQLTKLLDESGQDRMKLNDLTSRNTKLLHEHDDTLTEHNNRLIVLETKNGISEYRYKKGDN